MKSALRIVCCLAGLWGLLLQPVSAGQFGAGSGTSYPSSLDTTNTRTNKGGGACSSATTTFICAEFLNDHQSATAAIEAELGAGVKGSSASVKERIAGIRSLSGATADVITISGSNVGIGTTSPGAKLEVVGNIKVKKDSVIQFGGTWGESGSVLTFNNGVSTALQISTVGYSSGNTYYGVRATHPFQAPSSAIVNYPSYGFSGETGLGIYNPTAGAIGFVTSVSERMRIDSAGNVGIGTTTFGTSAATVLGLGNGTAPTSSPANMVQLWAEPISSSSELRVRDQAGNVTTLSPHSADILDALPHTSPFPWIYRSSNNYLGQSVWVDMSAVVAAVEKLTGQVFAHYAAIPRRDWDADQAEAKSARNAEIIAMQDRKREKELAREKATDDDARQKLDEEIKHIIIPEPYREQPMPRWMQHRLQPDTTPMPQQPSKGGRS